jgi:hypothetical protein
MTERRLSCVTSSSADRQKSKYVCVYVRVCVRARSFKPAKGSCSELMVLRPLIFHSGTGEQGIRIGDVVTGIDGRDIKTWDPPVSSKMLCAVRQSSCKAVMVWYSDMFIASGRHAIPADWAKRVGRCSRAATGKCRLLSYSSTNTLVASVLFVPSIHVTIQKNRRANFAPRALVSYHTVCGEQITLVARDDYFIFNMCRFVFRSYPHERYIHAPRTRAFSPTGAPTSRANEKRYSILASTRTYPRPAQERAPNEHEHAGSPDLCFAVSEIPYVQGVLGFEYRKIFKKAPSGKPTHQRPLVSCQEREQTDRRSGNVGKALFC